MQKISEHVYWLPPGEPDRPSLCVVIGSERTLLLDAGSSAAHVQIVLDFLTEQGIAAPSLVALTHWHWDHVFATSEIDAPIIAHELTAVELERLAGFDWSDEGIDSRAAQGYMVFSGAHIKAELPAPRTVRIAQAAITFKEALTVNLGGGVTCRIQHVGGDHSADSCVMFIEPDQVLFLGDALYDAVYAPVRHYKAENLLPLLDQLQTFGAQHYVEGHHPIVTDQAAYDTYTGMMRAAIALVQAVGTDEMTVFAAAREQIGELDEDAEYFLRALIAGAQQ